MGPTFGPVLPRMHRGIGGDVIVRPVWRGALLVVPLEGCGIILPLIAEELPEFLVPGRARDETIPVVVANFVAEVSEKGPVGLAQFAPDLLALRVVGLFDIERDEAI